MTAESLQLCPTLCNPMVCSPPGSSVCGILQARILEWVAIPPPGDLPDSGIEPKSLMSPVFASRFFTTNHLEIYIVLIHGYLVILCPCLALPKLIQKSKSSGVTSDQAGLSKGIDIRG